MKFLASSSRLRAPKSERFQHPLAMEVNEGFVYCYDSECDDYVLNDTPGGDIRILR